MAAAGLLMFLLVAVLLLGTGLPAFIVLIGVAALFAVIGVGAGAVPLALLTALPNRILGLLENDLLQALPLYVMMGALLNRLPLADILFRVGNRLFARSGAAPLLSALGLGALLAPMNGSVGASVATLSRVVHPRLLARGIDADDSLAIVCFASTLGVVVPPSLVLILLGDAMLVAHTQALTATPGVARVINTQDVFRGTLGPAAILLLASFAWVWRSGRGLRRPQAERMPLRAWLTGGITLAFIVGLLAAVTAGYLYAVEAAATGAVALLLFGAATRTLTGDVLTLVLRNTMAVTGALFALFIGATSFTLVFRALGSDELLAGFINAIPGGPMGAVIAVMALLGLSALVLDAFEIILVIVPLIMPPLLMRESDAVWVSALTLLALQASFLVPPIGYAVMMARTATAESRPLRGMTRALLPFLALQLLVMGLTLAFPVLTHVASDDAAPVPRLRDEEIQRRLDSLVPMLPPDDDQR